jgi:hypothetical protein
MAQSEHETILAALNEESKIAQLEWDAATQRFDEVISQVPSRLHHPDHVDRIHHASRELTVRCRHNVSVSQPVTGRPPSRSPKLLALHLSEIIERWVVPLEL